MIKEDKKRIFRFAALQAGMAALLTALFFSVRAGLISVPCLFHRLTGLSCPGCGITRAVLACARGEFLSALHFNYLFPLEAGYIVWAWLNSSFNYLKSGSFAYKSPAVYLDFAVLVSILAWGIVRNILKI